MMVNPAQNTPNRIIDHTSTIITRGMMQVQTGQEEGKETGVGTEIHIRRGAKTARENATAAVETTKVEARRVEEEAQGVVKAGTNTETETVAERGGLEAEVETGTSIDSSKSCKNLLWNRRFYRKRVTAAAVILVLRTWLTEGATLHAVWALCTRRRQSRSSAIRIELERMALVCWGNVSATTRERCPVGDEERGVSPVCDDGDGGR